MYLQSTHKLSHLIVVEAAEVTNIYLVRIFRSCDH